MPPRMPPKKPEQDSGRNEYIPSFISKKPFYVAEDESADASDYLEHQRLQKSQDAYSSISQKWYDRGKKLGPAATKYRKGACENCGAMTHKTKECLSRPRKQGAKWTGKDIEADEVVQDVQLGWDAKRDRWNGYDASEYQQVVEEYNALEEMKRKYKSEEGDSSEKLGNGDADDGDENDDKEEGLRYEEETDMGRQQATSTRNLRIREDTAKYLINLDLDSAKYDPKTRSMVDSGATSDQASALVAEEGFMKASGDAAEFETAQRYAWEKQERGDKDRIHLQANPTSGEFQRRKEREESDAKREVQRKALVEKYGDQDHLNSNPLKQAGVTESERFVEYDERGMIKGTTESKPKSQYAEDVFINNHTSVWGSWWRDFQWGYACCHSTVKNSYCTGDEGKRALEEADLLETQRESPKAIAWQDEGTQEKQTTNAADNDDDNDDDEKTKADVNARKRRLDAMKNGVDDEDMEEFRRKRVVADDPMLNYLGKDELVH